MNTLFKRWRDEGFVWLPERGMGYYPVRESDDVYNAEYFAKYERYASTPMGRAITQARIDLVRRHTQTGELCDVGIGSGAFVKAALCYGYDINPAGEEWLIDNGCWWDPYHTPVDAVTLWDVLEHLKNPETLLANVKEWVFVSLPIVPGDGPPPLNWRHLRKDEHCLYWTRAGLIAWMWEHGFRCAECNAAETILGRADVESFAFRRCSP